MCFCLQLDKLKPIFREIFERFSWLFVTYRFKQCISLFGFKYFNEQCPNCLNEFIDVATESNFQNLKSPFGKTNYEHYVLRSIDPAFWNQIIDTVKSSNNLNTLQHDFKKYFLKQLENFNNSLKLVFNF